MDSSKSVLESLGIGAETIIERTVERIVDELMISRAFDEDGDPVSVRSPAARKVQALVEKRIDETVSALAEKHLLPRVTQSIETIVLQRTNEWGEKKGEPLTFLQYLTERADAYMMEDVDWEGKPKHQTDSYSWRKYGSRVSTMIDRHLHLTIEAAMKSAVADANSKIARGLLESVKTCLQRAVDGVKVSIDVKR